MQAEHRKIELARGAVAPLRGAAAFFRRRAFSSRVVFRPGER